jgi:hypothetical protein
LVEGLADATGGRSDFVQSGEDLSVKVIPQLELSVQPGVSGVTVQIDGQEGLELSPYPVGNITPNVSFPFYIRGTTDIVEGCPILVTGALVGEQLDTLIEAETCAGSERISSCLRPLFAFETIRSLERAIRGGQGNVDQLKERCVSESLQSGVLCSETAFVGFTNTKYRSPVRAERQFFGGNCRSLRPCCVSSCCAAPMASMPCAMPFAPPPMDFWDVGASPPMDCCDFDASPELDGCDFDASPHVVGSASAASAAAPGGFLSSYHSYKSRRTESGKSASFDLRSVTSLQSINGSWTSVDALFELISRRIPLFSSLAGHAEADAVFATIIGVAILRTKFQDRAPAWRMIEAKAVKWLTGRCDDFRALIDEAVRQLSS